PHASDPPPVAASHQIDDLFARRLRIEPDGEAMFRGGACYPAASRDGVHHAIELALAETGDLAPAAPDDALARVVRHHEVSFAKRLDRDLLDPCGLRTHTTLDDLLNHCP